MWVHGSTDSVDDIGGSSSREVVTPSSLDTISVRGGVSSVPGVRPGGPQTELQRLLLLAQQAGNNAAAQGTTRHQGSDNYGPSASGTHPTAREGRRPLGVLTRSSLTRDSRDTRADCADALARQDASVDSMVQPLLEKVARDLGGVARVELWYSRRPQGLTTGPLQLVAHWMDSAYILPLLHHQECQPSVKSAITYLTEETQAWSSPGSGLAGVLYSEAGQALHRVRWRRLVDMAVDPLLPYDRRTIQAAKLFKYAGGVELPDGHGVLVVLTKQPYSADSPEPICMLNSALPVINSAAQGLQSIATFAAHSHHHVSTRREKAAELWSLLRSACLGGNFAGKSPDAAIHVGNSTKSMTTTNFSSLPVDMSVLSTANKVEAAADTAPDNNAFSRWLVIYGTKALGAGGTPVPMGSWASFGWTWGGVFISLLITSAINLAVLGASDDLFFLVGSLGALNTLMFAVPNAPLVQPRNVILGHTIGTVVALLFTYISSPAFYVLLPQWVAVAVAPATAIALMGKLGVVHPPAGAACLIYISAAPGSKVAELGWIYVVMPVIASALLTVVVGILWNNLSSSRQYPIYW